MDSEIPSPSVLSTPLPSTEVHQDDTADAESRALHTQLIPPDDTSNWGRETLNLFNNAAVTWTNGASAGTITWNVDVYKYVSGAALDDPNFSSRGEIVLLFVHSGTVKLGTIYFERQFQVEAPSNRGITVVKQSPTHGVQNGEYYQHTVDYRETLQLRRNNGNELFSWEVIYDETFTRSQFAQQVGEISGHLIAESAVAYWRNPSNPQSMSFPIKGITVFKARDPSKFPVTFYFRHRIRYGRDTYNRPLYANKQVSLKF